MEACGPPRRALAGCSQGNGSGGASYCPRSVPVRAAAHMRPACSSKSSPTSSVTQLRGRPGRCTSTRCRRRRPELERRWSSCSERLRARHLDQRGEPRRVNPRRMSARDVLEAARRCEAGASLAMVAAAFSIDAQTVDGSCAEPMSWSDPNDAARTREPRQGGKRSLLKGLLGDRAASKPASPDSCPGLAGGRAGRRSP